MVDINELGSNYTQTIKKLQKIGINTYEDLVELEPIQLSKKIGVGVGTAKNMKQIAVIALKKQENILKIKDIQLPDEKQKNRAEQWTINGIFKKIKGCTLTVPFDFQRNEFWTEEQMQDLIDSLACGVIIPQIYVYENKEKGCFEIIDGQQRCATIRELCENRLEFLFSSPKALEDGLDILNHFHLNDLKERNIGTYNDLLSKQLDVVILTGMTREEAQDFYVTLNASNSEMSNGELFYAIRGAFHSTLEKTRNHVLFNKLMRSKRRGDLEAVTNLLSIKYNDGFALKQFKRNKNRTVKQFRNISTIANNELYSSFTNDLDWCYDILCHVNMNNASGTMVNLVSVLLAIREDNPEVSQEDLISCLNYLLDIIEKPTRWRTNFKADFENFAEHYTNSSGDAIKKTWKAVERVFNRGKELWQDEDHGSILGELMNS